MITDIRRRLRILEGPRHRDMTGDELACISDDDLDWLVSLPARENRTAYDFSRWTPEDFARAEAIKAAAIEAAREARHARV